MLLSCGSSFRAVSLQESPYVEAVELSHARSFFFVWVVTILGGSLVIADRDLRRPRILSILPRCDMYMLSVPMVSVSNSFVFAVDPAFVFRMYICVDVDVAVWGQDPQAEDPAHPRGVQGRWLQGARHELVSQSYEEE